jgi:SNF2 family DNA or RNA helicase
MAQAIARSRRYGQTKKVHIYHIVAQRTIDVDILEHRHRRSDGITTVSSNIALPKPSSTRKERTKLVRNRKGDMALVPSSWLEDKAERRMLDIEETPASFTSLINLSETFEQVDDE